LQEPAVYSEYVVPICLPDQASTDEGDFYEGIKGIVVGWGWIKDTIDPSGQRGEYQMSDWHHQLEGLPLTVVRFSECLKVFYAKLHSFLCVFIHT